jgi:hypothetical protein
MLLQNNLQPYHDLKKEVQKIIFKNYLYQYFCFCNLYLTPVAIFSYTNFDQGETIPFYFNRRLNMSCSISNSLFKIGIQPNRIKW